MAAYTSECKKCGGYCMSPEKCEWNQMETKLAKVARMVASGKWEANKAFGNHADAIKYGRAQVKRLFPDTGTFTTYHDNAWHVCLYPSREQARNLGLIG